MNDLCQEEAPPSDIDQVYTLGKPFDGREQNLRGLESGLVEVCIHGQEAKGQRDTGINTVHMSYRYTLKEIADYLGIHYTTVSKVIGKIGINKK